MTPLTPPAIDAPTDSQVAHGSALRRHRFAVLGIMGPISAVGMMSAPLFGLILARMGVSEFWIGVNAACAAVAIVASSFLGPRLLSSLSLSTYMAFALAITVATLGLFALTEGYLVWTLLRTILGFATGAVFLAAEYWIVTVAPPERRGREVGYYALIISLGMAIGPILLLPIGSQGALPWIACVAVAAIAFCAFALNQRLAPSVQGARKSGAIVFFFKDPSLLWAVVLFGSIEFGAFMLLPVWLVDLGLTETEAFIGLVMIAIGALIAQPLIGIAIDRYPPRPLLILDAIACVLLPFFAAIATDVKPLLYMALLLWGGLAGGLYTVSLATLGGRYSGAELAAANAAVVAGYGVGAFVGPFMIGAMMSLVGSNGFPLACIVIAFAYLVLVLIRARFRSA